MTYQDRPEGVLYIPNVFSPNGDNINDVFLLATNEGTDIRSIEVSVFDRWAT
jgi:gliding motility-associated-like protein